MSDLAVREREITTTLQLPSLLEFHSPSAALSIVSAQPVARGVIWVVCTLVACCLGAAGLIPIDKVVTAPGRVVAQSATTVVQPLETAIVRSVDVREGQRVKVGELLARLDPTFATADLSALQSQVGSLEAEVARLQAEATDTIYHPPNDLPISVLQGAIFSQRQAERGFKVDNFNQKISSLQSQVQRAMTDQTAYSERLRLAADLEGKRLELERLHVGSQIARLEAQSARVEAKRGLDAAMAQITQSARDLQAMQAERDGYNQQWRAQVSQDLTDQGRKLSDAKENLNKAQLRRQLVEMRATEDSIVQNVAKVSPGSVLQSGEQLMSLVPSNAPLEVEINVAGQDSGFVHSGNLTTVKLDTFPASQYGTVEGRVRYVSPDSFTSNPDEKQRGVQQMPGSGPAFYRARVSMDEVKLHDTPDNFRLGPGMPVTTDIKVGKRTLLSYLLSRVLPVAMDGMREP